MKYLPLEAEYPVSFRQDDVSELASHIRDFHSVEIIGMKRVGISNYLRFFLNNKAVQEKYFSGKNSRVFIQIDLIDLVETGTDQFWLLTFRRIVQAVEKSDLPSEFKESVEHDFEKALQIKDTFLVVESIRSTLLKFVEQDVYPVIFFIRFDRLLDVITKELFSNLLGIRDNAHGKVSYIFTSYRTLSDLKPEVFERNTMSIFSIHQFLQPINTTDSEVIFETFEEKYSVTVEKSLKKKLIELCGGHVQYLQLALILYKEQSGRQVSESEFITMFKEDERVILQSEELFSNLSKDEQDVLVEIACGRSVDKKKGSYVWDCGMVKNGSSPLRIFSPLLKHYILSLSDEEQVSEGTYLTSKENGLFTILKEYEGSICERDVILASVWAEFQAIGVSDWAVDRLVARLRKKLKTMDSEYAIKTIRTRGFMLYKRS